MTVYICVFLISLLLAKGLQNVKIRFHNKRIEWIKALIISIPFSIAAGFRADTVGIDYKAYSVSYYDFGNLATGREREILGIFVIRLANMIENPKFIIWFYAVFISVGVMLWIVRQKQYAYVYPVALFFLTGYFNWSLNIMRQTAASVMVFLFLDLLFDKSHQVRNRIILGIIILIAATMHSTALLYLVLLIFPYNLFKNKIKWFSIALFFLPMASAIFRMLFMYLSQRFNFYYRYFNNYYDQNAYTGSLILVSAAIYAIALLSYQTWKNSEQKKYNVYAAIQYISVAFSLLANIIPNNARVTYLFFPAAIVSLPIFSKLINIKYKKIVIITVIAILALFYIHAYYISNWGETMPYKWGI
ncbi:MAG: EpsG family protein [Lachnospiraceae bacterium]|jgi:hypothetical protein|nr:EpsG family protein [Lachnospiraceae bacterium]